MPGFRSNPPKSLLLSLGFCLLVAFTSASSHISHTGGGRGDDDAGGSVVWETRRSLASGTAQNSSLLLAEERTRRRDPLDSFKKYNGGWNISNEHYWASVGFTAVPFFAVAAVWFVIFGLSLSLICLCYCCCPREPYGYSRTCYALSLILLILFTLAAIVGCIVLYTGQGKFHSSTTKTLDYVVSQADKTVGSLRNLSGYLGAAKRVGVDSVFLPSDVQSNIDNIRTKLDSASSTLDDKSEKNSKSIQDVLDSVGLALIIVAAVMLFLAFLGFVFSIFGWQALVYFLVIVGWVLVAGTFILCGVFLLFHNVVADSCVSMDEWVQNPTSHTALDDILPCVDNATAQETAIRAKDVTHQLVTVVNRVINNISNVNYPPIAGPLYFNQSGPRLPVLCDPFNSDLSDRQCAPGEVELKNATQVWKRYVCEASATGICRTVGRLNPIMYGQMEAARNVSYGLYRYGPFLVDLQDCTFVRVTFTDISKNNCPSLRKHSEWIYIGLVMVSAAVMLSLIFWVIYARERRHRVYTKKFASAKTAEEFEDKGDGGDQREHGGVVVTWGTRRSLAEEKTPRNAPLMILSRERTRRKDPRDGFKRYTGGWNISNEHYWASVNYTATPFLVIAVVWFKIFAISLCLTCICNFCRPKEPYGYSRRAYALSPIFLVFFTLAAIIGFIVLFSGQGKFQGSSTDALNHVVSQANTTAAKLRNVSYNLSAAKRIGVDAVFLPEDVQKKIDNIVTKIDASAATLSDRTKKNLKTIKDSLNTMRILLINLVAAMIFLALLGILFSILGKQVGVHILVIVGWILVTLAFILCGAFVVLHNAIGDACVAMDEWVQNPKPHTAFDDILPCVDNATAQEAALRTKDATFQLVTVVNHVITNASNVDNQSDRPVPLLCNPFHSNLIDRHCISGEVPLQNATQVWKKYVCEVSKAGTCTKPGSWLTPTLYGQMETTANLSYVLYGYVKFLTNLQSCRSVRDAFRDISSGKCHGLEKHSSWIYIGLAMVSAALVLSMIFWFIYARERSHRLYIENCFLERAI
ncbi:hypothetical protein ACFX13_026618 [Malus domestica]